MRSIPDYDLLWVTSNSGTPTRLPIRCRMPPLLIEPTVVSDKRLDSPSIAISEPCRTVDVQNNYNLEASPPTSYFDGGVLEISIGRWSVPGHSCPRGAALSRVAMLARSTPPTAGPCFGEAMRSRELRLR